MNYTQLINVTCESLNLTEDDIHSITINLDSKTVAILTRNYAKYVAPFPAEDPYEYYQDTEPRPKRVKAVKRAR